MRGHTWVLAGLIAIVCGGCSSGPPGVVVTVDTPSALVVDGVPQASLAAGSPREVPLDAGDHLVVVVSAGGEARWEAVVPVAGASVPLKVSLATTVAAVGRDHVRVPAGTYERGCVDGDGACLGNETPRHEVTLTRDFWLMKTEVTVAAYKAFVAKTRGPMPAESDTNPGWRLDDHPIMNVTWDEAAAYCEGVGGRLPTEAEWEYAARGGKSGWTYVWGPAVTPLIDGRPGANVGDERAKAQVGCPQCGWFDGYDDGYVYTAPVGSFAANGYGLHDMAGNVIEWCADWYRERVYAESPAADPEGSEFGRWRVIRGGSWSMGPAGLRLSSRGGFPPDRTTDNYGMRCARDVAVP